MAVVTSSVPATRGRFKARAGWPFALAAAELLLYALSSQHARFPATIAGIVCFALLTGFVPAAAVRTDRPVCPLNWFLLLFYLQLVVDPLLICFAGPYQNTLAQLPANLAINVAELVSVIAFVAFVTGCELARRRVLRRPPWAAPALVARPWRTAGILLALGILGLALAFHTPGALVSYFRQAQGHVGLQQAGAGPVHVASLILRSCLQFAFVVPWCLWLDRRHPSGWRLWLISLFVLVAVAVSEATFAYNRGSIVAPLIALLAVLGASRLRLRLSALIVVAMVAFAVLAVARSYRNSDYTFAQAIGNAHDRSALLARTDLSREIQIYANAPQYLGFFLDREGYGGHPTYGLTTLSSILSPLPTLGKPWRATSGPTLFNRQVYGPYINTADQIVPFQGELFVDFLYPGVFLGYLLLGMMAAVLQRGFVTSSESLRIFGWQYASIWIGFLVIGTISVTSQEFIYFFWPLIVLVALAEWRRRREPDGGQRSTILES